MTSASIVAVARREMRDTVTDWRMMLPVLILTFAVPLLLQTALMFLLSYLNENSTIIHLIPFGVLLCGFLPASFSLIGALESFVGEKERNTLESLLAMPMSDHELYLGKLIAAVMSPMVSSLLAMLTFTSLILLGAPAKVIQGLTPWLMAEMVALVMCKAVVMVAAAVIVSSHTTTTRAANLLASLILVPMASLVQIEALLVIAGNQRTLACVLLALIVVAIMLIRAGMSAFNREDILSREHAGFSFRNITWSFKRFFRAYHPAGVAPEHYTESFSIMRFYRRELPVLLWDYRQPLFVVTSGSVAALIVGFALWSTRTIHAFDAILLHLGQSNEPSWQAVRQMFIGDSYISMLVNLAAPFSFGVFAYLTPLVSFAQIGYCAGWALVHHGSFWPFVLGYILPHGLLKLPALMLSAALGLRIGVALLYAPKGFSIGQNVLWALANFLKVWLLVLLPLFFVAATIQAFVTPHIALFAWRA
ncbi:MAG: stage II sporulation protein M [Herpetosiphonaceae bacterium]|nr:stage II sporulation protein M [Herpetosiphonaceae bacterium]